MERYTLKKDWIRFGTNDPEIRTAHISFTSFLTASCDSVTYL